MNLDVKISGHYVANPDHLIKFKTSVNVIKEVFQCIADKIQEGRNYRLDSLFMIGYRSTKLVIPIVTTGTLTCMNLAHYEGAYLSLLRRITVIQSLHMIHNIYNVIRTTYLYSIEEPVVVKPNIHMDFFTNKESVSSDVVFWATKVDLETMEEYKESFYQLFLGLASIMIVALVVLSRPNYASKTLLFLFSCAALSTIIFSLYSHHLMSDIQNGNSVLSQIGKCYRKAS